jgi:hypothetical protein
MNIVDALRSSIAFASVLPPALKKRYLNARAICKVIFQKHQVLLIGILSGKLYSIFVFS